MVWARCYIVVIFLLIADINFINGKNTITYTINNQLEEPFFHESLEMDYVNKKPLIWYMEQAVLTVNHRFKSFTAIFQVFEPVFCGYFIKGINGREAFWFINRTNWQIWNGSDQVIGGKGVSFYFPTKGDHLFFNYTIGFPGFVEN